MLKTDENFKEESKRFDSIARTFKFISTSTPDTGAEGQHCGGFIQNAPTCPAGYSCKLSNIPDAGGVCVKN